MDRNLALEFVRVTEAAAIEANAWVGKGDKKAADKAATEAMRSRFNSVDINGTVVIGEGERDEAPMLYIGEKVGSGKGMEIDIAVDPIEGTNSVAFGYPNSIAVFAAGPRGTLLHAPDMYMNKIAVGPKAANAGIHLDKSVKENVEAVANALGKPASEVTVIVLDRPRHEQIIKEIREAGAKVRLISDGDVAGAIAPCLHDSGVDMLMGIGAAPEGVIATTAVKCFGGFFQGRLAPKDDAERERAKSMGVDPDKLLEMEDLAKGDSLQFAATGIVEGPILKGVTESAHGVQTHSLVMRSKTKTIRFIETHHHVK
ncbi:fructose-bisphosphatase class II [Candidatus Woesearchaeota archaeon]|nr:fructose-bisphosphatase class II [Candidatus Woesearchaeota archaeon]|tara:strand:+ start:26602 stop:27543 length:942 start_codon:yes stop_codon:yes gene_type:complete